MFVLGDRQIDPETRDIRTGADVVRVSPKAMGVLLHLRSAAGGVVARAELLDEVWPDVTVGEEVLTHAIAELRRALGDQANAPRFIETVHKSGYRLLAQSREPATRSSSAPARSGAIDRALSEVGGGSIDLSLPERPSLVVLPFRALGGGNFEQALADGLSRDIAVVLARTRWLFVSARASAATLLSGTDDPTLIARRLGVRYVVEGAVICADGQMRLSARLNDAVAGADVWAEIFERRAEALFEVLDEVATRVALTVEAEIEIREQQRAALRPIASLDAWGAYHRAMTGFFRSGPHDLDEIGALLERARTLDPISSRILAALAALHARRTMLLGASARTQELCRAAEYARQSVAADPRDPQAQMVLGRTHTLSGDADAAISRLTDAVDLNGNFAHVRFYLAYALLYAGRRTEALVHLDQARRLSPYDPLTFGFLSLRAQLLSLEGAVEEGADWADRALSQPGAHFQNLTIAAWCSERAGRHETARRHLAAARIARPGFSTDDYFAAFRFSAADRSEIEASLRQIG